MLSYSWHTTHNKNKDCKKNNFSDEQYPRNLIFNSVIRNEDFGNMELLSYISVTESLKCEAAFDEQSWTTLEQYVHEASYSSLSGWDLGFTNPETSFYGSSLLTIPPNSFNINLGKIC